MYPYRSIGGSVRSVLGRFPNSIILDLKREMLYWHRVVCELDMPVIDDDATLQLIFDAIKYENDSMSLEKMAHHISLGEGLWEDDGEANGIQKRTMDAVIDLGGEIKNNLLRIKAYVDGELPYEYRRMLDDSSVILTKRQKYWCQTTHSF